ncbi:MAG TPA: hypothetical protein VMS65_04100 [Polyangiaceae bacterium]|nr:hypothetical protein [Polyangiaceae bacterium]
MSRRAWLLSFLVAGAAIAACIVLALEIAGYDSKRRGDRRSPRHEHPQDESVSEAPRTTVPRVPIEAAALPPVEVRQGGEPVEGETLAGTPESVPSEWPPARAFTLRCRAANGRCPEGCTELAGNRCLDPCFIHTAECSRDCLKPDGTCGFPPPDTE